MFCEISESEPTAKLELNEQNFLDTLQRGQSLKDRTKGIICIILAGFSFACMTLFLKAAGDIPTFEKAFFRNFVAMIIAFFLMLKERVPFSAGGKGNMKFVLARSIFGGLGMFANFYAVDHMVIADANMLNKLSPFFALIFSIFLLKEMVKPFQVIAILIALTGSVFIVKPFFFSDIIGNGSAAGSTVDPIAALLGLLGGLGAGIAYANLRAATKRGTKKTFIVFFFSLFTTVLCIPLMLPDWVPLSPRSLLLLILTGVAAAGGQFGITAAYSFAPAREISVYDYSQIVFAALLGMIFLNELPDLYSIIGYFIILFAGIFMFLRNRKEPETQ